MPVEKSRAVIEKSDMIPEMEEDAVYVASSAMDKHNVDMHIASFIKHEFDRKYKTTWNCIVGKNFGSFIHHEKGGFVSFRLNGYNILLFKLG
ncbi:unnamed protein product [Trichobilharzia regenti]|uniref:Dynein light chain n=1 Tax=Trichobilharzia regenti TaxID=157069 RepID=A0A183VXI3_TRIRE|nr:unnamed protein product [Trichobilharzia regenti]VDQ01069.1 unnamed protein product [Trichobilharzia regenti]